MNFENFPDNSQVWIYGANRFLTSTEENFVQEELDKFITNWATHGTDLFAKGSVLHHNFIVIVADENKVRASGCSIDSSVRFLKDLGNELNVDFFNRLSVLLEKEGDYKRIPFNELAENMDWNMFDPMVKNLAEFKSKWIVPVSESIFVK